MEKPLHCNKLCQDYAEVVEASLSPYLDAVAAQEFRSIEANNESRAPDVAAPSIEAHQESSSILW